MERQREDNPVSSLFSPLLWARWMDHQPVETYCNHLARFSSFAVEGVERWNKFFVSPKVLSADNDPKWTAHHREWSHHYASYPRSLLSYFSAESVNWCLDLCQHHRKHLWSTSWGTRLDRALLLSPAFQPHDRSDSRCMEKHSTQTSPPETGSTWAMDMGVTNS